MLVVIALAILAAALAVGVFLASLIPAAGLAFIGTAAVALIPVGLIAYAMARLYAGSFAS